MALRPSRDGERAVCLALVSDDAPGPRSLSREPKAGAPVPATLHLSRRGEAETLGYRSTRIVACEERGAHLSRLPRDVDSAHTEASKSVSNTRTSPLTCARYEPPRRSIVATVRALAS